MRERSIAMALAGLLLVGCGPPTVSHPAGALAGSMAGHSFIAASGAASVYTGTDCATGGATSEILLFINDTSDACGEFTDEVQSNGSAFIVIAVRFVGAVGAAIEISPGTYPVTATNSVGATQPTVSAGALISDDRCHQLALTITGGTVTISSYADGAAAGSAQLTFEDGSTATGDFDAPACSSLTGHCTDPVAIDLIASVIACF